MPRWSDARTGIQLVHDEVYDLARAEKLQANLQMLLCCGPRLEDIRISLCGRALEHHRVLDETTVAIQLVDLTGQVNRRLPHERGSQ